MSRTRWTGIALAGWLGFASGSYAQEAAPAPTAAPPAPEAPAALVADEAVTPDPQNEAPIELSAAELAELGLSTMPGASALDKSLRLWGFADFTTQTFFTPDNSAWKGALNRHTSFFIGNFNLYFSKNITERIRTMGEVRFSYMPNGARTIAGTSASTEVLDYADLERTVRWGGILIQRIYAEVTLHELAILRMGQFLTPYGIWNVDHGSPTIITIQRPSIILRDLFPERQTGLELFGRWRAANDHVLGYHLTLSNGFGPVSEYRDLDANKAVGGRAYWIFERLGTLQVGGSFFYGTDTATTDTPGLGPDRRLAFTETTQQQSKVLALAADVRWQYKNLILQSEFLVQQRKYTHRGRVGAVSPLQGAWIAPVDDVPWGFYAMAGYRFDWLGIMPYALVGKLTTTDPRSFSKIEPTSYLFGINTRPVDEFVVKLEYSYSQFSNANFLSNKDLHVLQAQVAWAF